VADRRGPRRRVVGALILVFAYFAGVALIGAGFGAMTAHLLWTSPSAASRGSSSSSCCRSGRAGRALARALRHHRRHRARRRADGHRGRRGAPDGQTTTDAASRAVYRVYPLDPLPGTEWDLYAWIALALLGLLVQLGSTARGSKGKG
jgi:hypothetical protein